MATTDHIPIEKKAKGRSNVFKFVTLRNPQSPSSEESQRQFVYHPNTEDSTFIKGFNPNEKTTFENLKKTVDEFKPLSSIEDLKKMNQSLFDFSDWLFRNKTVLDIKTIGELVNASTLKDEELITVWDNLFYYAIENKSKYLREALLMLIVANNFVNKHRDENLITTNEELRTLANAKVVIPKIILSRPTKEIEHDFSSKNKNEFAAIDDYVAQNKIHDYENAIVELQEVNRVYIEDLSQVDISELENKGNETKSEVETEVITFSISKEDILEAVGNPLDEEKLKDKVSEKTLGIVKDLDLSKHTDPLSAIEIIKKQIQETNSKSFANKTLNKKHIVVGGSIIEVDKSRNASNEFSQGCFPSIIDTVGVTVNDSQKYIKATTNGFGNSGGASQNKIDEYGSLSFTLTKLVRGSTFGAGLSSINSDADMASIQYGVIITESIALPGTTPVFHAIITTNGTSPNVSQQVYEGDQIKISRVYDADGAKIVWELYRPSTSYLGTLFVMDDSSSGALEPLMLDFAFSKVGQGIYDVRIDPCDGNGSIPGTSGSECSGVTNLGVSDYMRVEQEICCYTAGEVSHIENILQGEYKERSTRRLRRQETTTTFESESTTEKLRDTSTTDRYEMEQESSQVIQNDSAFDIGVTLSAKYGPVKLTTDTGFATASSSVEANAQAVNYAKEVSTRALDRVVNKIREERVNKVIEEFEENNLHGLDNTNNTEGHVTGLYRWVDKIYKNQVVNYGKRLNFEFMIPEPAKFHLWAMANNDLEVSLEEPKDPREHGLSKHTFISESNYAQWASEYDAKVNPSPAQYVEVMNGYSDEPNSLNSYHKSENTFQLPDGYILKSVELDGSHSYLTSNANKKFIQIAIADVTFTTTSGFKNIYGYKQGTLAFSMHCAYLETYFFNVTAKLERKPELYEQWKIDTFNKIMEAYRQKKAAYDNAVAEAKAQNSLGIQIQGNNPLHNRQIEQQELKKNCLKWLEVQVGNSHYSELNVCEDAVDMPSMDTSGDLACYSQKAKFFEQAFDWDIMSYLFYPYFWGKKCSWKEIYKLDDNDPVFRGFLQAGMARVVVPVKPNYEKAVMYYLETGDVWNGGEVPVPEDPLYVSIVDELSEQDPIPVGDPWETRVPTSLNILQKDNAAVDGDGLPCNCNDYEADGTGGSTLIGNSEAPQ